jgi:hypothetical protein
LGQSWNPYSYVRNNPLSYVDPSGFEPDAPDPSGTPTRVTQLPDGPNGEIQYEVVPILDEPSKEPEEEEDKGEKVGAYVPPVDVSPTGNTATYDPQPVTTAEEDWRGEPAAQFRSGMLAGLAVGLVPFGGIGEQLFHAAGVLPQTQNFRVGVAIGQIFGGLALILKGGTGAVLGGGASATGIGAAAGVPAIAVSTTWIAGGIGNIVAGVQGLMTTGSGSSAAKGGGRGRDDHDGGVRRGSSAYREKTPSATARDGRMVRDAARQVGVDARAFGDYVESTKFGQGRGPSANFTYDELLDLAREFQQSGGK